ncbi:sensor histidine kinase [Draconibacterium halophilum]|uniref:histidine kinase n=1 Tax=Draconibacterium halophilum TaxID=2706887 RepID=A0A6C0RFR2_9BACT|nr:HAMP domain-containing sensor histidine kinase [Draconibacterium halophilum]QIA09354.1 cell wall metabolism sensor histidine kinase WalK [Draconibacterium halophilum]
MNKKTKPVSRLTLVFILAVVLSGSILTWFSINNISNLKKITEKQVLEEQQELTSKFINGLQEQIDKVIRGFKGEISPFELLKDSLLTGSREFEFVTQAFILDEKGDFLYPYFIGVPEKLKTPKFSASFKSSFTEGEKAEFSKSDFKKAKRNYLSCLRYSSASNDSVKAINALGRISVKLKEYENAIRYYNQIISSYYREVGESGFPYVYYAVPQLIKTSNPNNCDDILIPVDFCVDKMASGEIPLNHNTEDFLQLMSNWLQKYTFNAETKILDFQKNLENIKQQLQFLNEYETDISGFIREGRENLSNVNNDFEVINSFAGNHQKLLLVNTNLNRKVGFLINGTQLFESILNTNLQANLEFDYNLEIQNGYNSNTGTQNLIYSSQLSPYFPGQMIQVKLNDENLIKDLIKRRSWIYGIAAALLMLAMLLGVVLILRDISREKRLAGLRSDFISNVTHELKTPLTSIYMYTESLSLGRIKSSNVQKEYFSIILNESERLKRMINNILEFSKMEKGKSNYQFVKSNLSECIRATVSELDYWLENENFDVSTELDNSIVAEIDKEKMKQALSNLISNAIKYSTDSKKISVRLYKNTKVNVIEIEDEGIGIAEDKLSQIFEKFYRVDQKENISGTGLGLTVVKEIIEAHNGKICVSSKLGKGTKFSINLNQ